MNSEESDPTTPSARSTKPAADTRRSYLGALWSGLTRWQHRASVVNGLKRLLTADGYESLIERRLSLAAIPVVVLGVVADLMSVFGQISLIGFWIAVFACIVFASAILLRTKYAKACSYPLVLSLMFSLTFGGLAFAQNTFTTSGGLLAEQFPQVAEFQQVLYEQVVAIRTELDDIDQKLDENEQAAERRHEESETHAERRHSELQAQLAALNRGLLPTLPVLANALASVDQPLLSQISEGEAGIDHLESAFVHPFGGNGTSAAYAFFANARGDAAAMDWFAELLAGGFDPVLMIQGSDYREEEILSAAIAAGNYTAARLLLEAGANSHPFQDITGTKDIRPLMLAPLAGIGAEAADRGAFVQLLREHGTAVPSALRLDLDGTLSERAKWEHEYFPAHGYTFEPAATLCENPKPATCLAASKRTGFDWCEFVAETPKGIYPPGDNPYRNIRMAQLEYFLGASDGFGHFWAPASDQIISISASRTHIRALRHARSYDCKHRPGEEAYCWVLSTASGSPNVYIDDRDDNRYRMTDFCSAKRIAREMDAQQQRRDRWMVEYQRERPLLDKFMASLFRRSLESSSAEFDAELTALRLYHGDRRALDRAAELSSMYPDHELKHLTWRGNTSDRAALHKFLRSGLTDVAAVRTNAEKTITVATYFSAKELDRYTVDTVEFNTSELASIVRDDASLRSIAPPSRLHLVRDVPSIEYDKARQVFRIGGARPSYAPTIWQPRESVEPAVIERGAYPDRLNARTLYKLWNRVRVPPLILDPLAFDEVAINSWSTDYTFEKLRNMPIAISHFAVTDGGVVHTAPTQQTAYTLALDRDARLHEFHVPEARAREILDNIPKPYRTGRFNGWRAVIELDDVEVERFTYEKMVHHRPEAAESWILTASLVRILMVAPDGSIAAEIDGSELPQTL